VVRSGDARIIDTARYVGINVGGKYAKAFLIEQLCTNTKNLGMVIAQPHVFFSLP